MKLRVIGKIGYLLGVIGFVMPLANITLSRILKTSIQLNGFDLAKSTFELDASTFGVLIYVFFIVMIAGLVIGILLLSKNNIPVSVDWLILLVSIGCALSVFFGVLSDDVVKLLSGAYIIAIGLGVALIAQIISITKKEN